MERSKSKNDGIDVVKNIPVSDSKNEVIVVDIFRTHIKRIGFLRTFIGGGLMYLSIIEFVFIHLTSIVVLYQLMLAPFFKIKKFRVRDYILIDRNRIEGMTLFDKFNCEFCAYANGSVKLWNDQLDEISKGNFKSWNIIVKLIAFAYSLCIMCFVFFNIIFSKFLFFLISLFHGYNRVKTRDVWRSIRERNYAQDRAIPMRWLILVAKTYAETLSSNLEQIESSWCPLKHFEAKNRNIVVPDHHKNFFPGEKFGDAIRVLAKDGTVSPLKPRY